MRLLLVISGLGIGGAERVVVSLAEAWHSRGDDVTIFTLNDSPVFYPLHSGIHRIGAGLASPSKGLLDGIRANLRRMQVLRKFVTECAPDVVIGFMDRTNVLTICATLGLNIPTIVCEHNDTGQLRIGAIWSLLRLITYPFASVVTFLTANVGQRWRPLLRERAVVMPNPVVVGEQDGKVSFSHPRNLIAVGRLVSQKGFDLLLESFREVASKHKEWGLTILGEGELRPQLEAMVERLGLSSRVSLGGRVENPFAWLRLADLFVMPSRFEGFPCSLCEAMACGLPAISFDCDSGPRDIIREGVDGLLVPPGNVQKLVTAMDELMSNPERRMQMSLRGPDILHRFGIVEILQKWDELFDRFCPSHELSTDFK